jgi:hypothetical protein
VSRCHCVDAGHQLCLSFAGSLERNKVGRQKVHVGSPWIVEQTVLVSVKHILVVPPHFDCLLKALEAVEDSELVLLLAVGRVIEGKDGQFLYPGKLSPSLLGRVIVFDD